MKFETVKDQNLLVKESSFHSVMYCYWINISLLSPKALFSRIFEGIDEANLKYFSPTKVKRIAKFKRKRRFFFSFSDDSSESSLTPKQSQRNVGRKPGKNHYIEMFCLIGLSIEYKNIILREIIQIS